MLQMDKDPWNDRKTDDYFRYIKFDYFVFTLYLTCLMVDSIFYHEVKVLEPLGPFDKHPTKTIFIIFIT